MMQKGDLYIRMFNNVYGVRLMFWLLSPLNILCIRQVKPTKLKYLNEVSSRIPVLLQSG